MVQWLMGLSCNIDAADTHGQTSLIAAAAHGHNAVVSCLLDASCDALATNASLMSALHVASAACNSTLLPLLLLHRCDSTHTSVLQNLLFNAAFVQWCCAQCNRYQWSFAFASCFAFKGS
jgi:ankyrin repeat protein